MESYSNDNIKDIYDEEGDWAGSKGVNNAIMEIYNGNNPTYSKRDYGDAKRVIKNKKEYDQSTIPQIKE